MKSCGQRYSETWNERFFLKMTGAAGWNGDPMLSMFGKLEFLVLCDLFFSWLLCGNCGLRSSANLALITWEWAPESGSTGIASHFNSYRCLTGTDGYQRTNECRIVSLVNRHVAVMGDPRTATRVIASVSPPFRSSRQRSASLDGRYHADLEKQSFSERSTA